MSLEYVKKSDNILVSTVSNNLIKITCLFCFSDCHVAWCGRSEETTLQVTCKWPHVMNIQSFFLPIGLLVVNKAV